MDSTINLTPIINQIEKKSDGSINKIIEEARGHFSSAVLSKIYEQFEKEFAQKIEVLSSAGAEINEIKSTLKSTIERALGLLSDQFKRRDLGDSAAYKNEKLHWKNGLGEAQIAAIEKYKLSIALDANKVKTSDSNKNISREKEQSPKQQPMLHPWRIVSSFIFELDSDEIVDVISLTGLQVDWTLSIKENYSHNTRKRAYRPRIDRKFFELAEIEKNQVTFIVASEFIQRYPDKKDELNKRLSAIGYQIKGNKLLKGSTEVSEFFFPTKSEHDAYVKLREIIGKAKQKVVIVDPYLDSTIFDLLSNIKLPLEIEMLSCKLPKDFAHELEKFRKQYKPDSLAIRRTREFHDRFVVVDDESCYHIGASIKDAGNRVFMINQIQDSENKEALFKQICNSWGKATPI
jgi:hypothetical protein